MTATQLMARVNNLERQIETIKWMLSSIFTVRHHDRSSIVRTTSGILGKDFPSGIAYETRIRKSWNKHFKLSK